MFPDFPLVGFSLDQPCVGTHPSDSVESDLMEVESYAELLPMQVELASTPSSCSAAVLPCVTFSSLSPFNPQTECPLAAFNRLRSLRCTSIAHRSLRFQRRRKVWLPRAFRVGSANPAGLIMTRTSPASTGFSVLNVDFGNTSSVVAAAPELCFFVKSVARI